MNVRALLELSGYKGVQLASHMADIVEGAPDPETAIRYMLSSLPIQSEVLEEKWRKYISQLWAVSHPRVPKVVHIPLTSKEVAFSPVLVELHTLIQELRDNPARRHTDSKVHFLHSGEEVRIAHELPLFNHDSLHVRRACALLEELRLLRPYKGYVRVIESRYREFAALPLPSQYYLVWHADMYHLDWKEYFREWGSHLVVFQQYLPMVWEIASRMKAGDSASIDSYAANIVRSFRPMWQQEFLAGIFEQSLLEGMVERWLIDKVFDRYGFIDRKGPDAFEWTNLGQRMIELERTAHLPCSTDVLS